jgi:hypothetical protein
MFFCLSLQGENFCTIIGDFKRHKHNTRRDYKLANKYTREVLALDVLRCNW